MKYSKFLIVSMAVLLAGGMAWAQATPEPDAPYVFVTDSDGEILRIENGQPSVVLDGYGAYFSDIVYGPDELLYACSPESGLIIRFDPTSQDPPEIFYEYEEPDTCMDECQTGCSIYPNPYNYCAYDGGECSGVPPENFPTCMNGCMSGECSTACGLDYGPCYEGCMAIEGEGCGEYVCEDICYGPSYLLDVGDGPRAPECGWFTHKGALVVTDQYFEEVPSEQTTGNGVWIFPQNTDDYPQCAGASPCFLFAPDGFIGGGVTQAANGDLIVADILNGTVLGVEYQVDVGFQTDDVVPLFDFPEDEVLGVARLSTGEIAATAGGTVEIYGNVEPGEGPPAEWIGDKPWFWQCDVQFPDDGCEYVPLFIEATASDWFYVTTMDYCYGGSEDNGYGGSLWAVDGNCNIYDDEPLFTNYGVLYGVALPPTWTPPTDAYDPEPENDVEEWFISYNDHVYELTLPDECDLYVNTDLDFVFAQEVPLSCLNNLIADYVDDPDFPVEFDAFPVTYLGEEAFGIVYNLEGSCGGGREATGEIIHAISAYTDTVNNPRIIRCFDDTEDPDLVSNGVLMDICYPEEYFDNYTCEVLELDSFFPGEGVLPDDGRIGSRGAASFSQYFVVQSGPDGYEPLTNPATTGDSCGFFWPYKGLTEPPATECFGCGDPPVFGPFAWAAFRAREDGGHCWWGPFVNDTNFLASVARVRDENGVTVFEQMELDTLIHGDSDNWFRQPRRWWKPYRISFWTYDWPEGIYQITAMDLEGGVPVFYDYFEIRHWCDNPGEKGCP